MKSAKPRDARLCEYRTVDLLTLDERITAGIQLSYRMREEDRDARPGAQPRRRANP
jgi:hypothetical protein